jgi:hypothetical protein
MVMKPKKILPKNGKRAGAPNKDPILVKNPQGLPKWMEERIEKEVDIQNISKAELNRTVYGWYFTALDIARGDVEAHKLFDESVRKDEENRIKQTKEI